MIIDKENQLSDAQAVTNSQASTNYIDLGSVRDVGVGTPLELTVKMGAAAQSTGSSTLVVALETDTQSGFGTKVTLAQSAAIAKASLVANADVWKIKVPEGVQRYLRAYYTVATADLTAGTISAFINLDRPAQKAYPSGLNMDGV
jgi:hypothetical protein